MDVRKAAPFELGKGREAVLLVHGFTGTPWDVLPLGEALAHRGYHVRGIRLPGHGGTPEDMLGATWRDWEQAVLDAFDALSSYRRVCVGGLSMGALLSLILAARRPGKVAALALLAPAVRFRDRSTEWLRNFQRAPILHLLRPWVEKDASDIADPKARAEAPILPRWPTRRLYDLWRLQDRARAHVKEVTAPALVVVAKHDHVVSAEAGARLARDLVAAPAVRLLELEEGFHIIPRDHGRERLFKEVGAFFDRGTRRDHGEEEAVRAGD